VAKVADASLNEEQLAAVLAPEGPLLLIAGAGSGKTRVITARIAHLIERCGVPPYRIMAMTFTNKAAAEMKHRVENKLAQGSLDILVTTFHSFGARLLRRDIGVLGRDSQFAIYDAADQQHVLKRVAERLNLNAVRYPIGRLRGAISRHKNEGGDQPPEDPVIARVLEQYQAQLEASNALDFDDLLLLPLQILRACEEQRVYWQQRFQHLLVDEYQDTNVAQLHLLKMLSASHHNIFAVGDEDQSIYGWRGAEIGNILQFEEHFPGASVLKLERNYRSTGSILAYANQAIAQNRMRHPKNLWTQEAEGEPVRVQAFPSAREEAFALASSILVSVQQQKNTFSSSAILFRSNFLSRQLEEAMRAMRIPYRLIGGTRFYERREIKDLLAFMRIVVNPRDWTQFERALAVPPRGIGATSLTNLARVFSTQGNLPKTMEQAVEQRLLTGRAQHGLAAFQELYRDLAARAREHTPSEWLEYLVKALNYREYLMRDDEGTAENRVGNIDELIASLAELEETGIDTLESFLDHSALVSDQDQVDATQDAVSLMTIHAAKGLEFDHVYVIGLEEGVFPNSRSMNELIQGVEEERRLFYVATTRARQRLTLSWARMRASFGQTQSGAPSRFLVERASPVQRSDQQQERQEETRGPRNRTSLSSHLASLERQLQAQNIHVRLADSAAPPSTEERPPLRAGQTVIHPVFGPGTVIQISPGTHSRRIEVHFPGKGSKLFLEGKAPLKPLSS
jgi:DNA helicase-2/ATP-dependent DNA helicase PcrA